MENDFMAIFNWFSRDGGATIPIAQLGDALRVFGASPSQAELTKICRRFQEAGTSNVPYEDFGRIVTLVLNKHDESAVGRMKTFLSSLDLKNTGYVEADQLRFVLTTMGEMYTEEEVEELFKGQVDENGMIDIISFANEILS